MNILFSTLAAILMSAVALAQSGGPASVTKGSGASDNESHETAAASLGRRLFADKRLSADGSVSCATCHIPEKAFSDRLPVAVGVNGQRGNRNTPSLWNVALLPNQFWDGRRSTLEEQAVDPLLNPREHGMQDEAAVLSVLRADPQYRVAFQSVFQSGPNDISLQQAATAIAAFERTLISGDSAFDRYRYGKEPLSAATQRGFDLFRGRAECATCHAIDKTPAALTDYEFHSLGVNFESVAPRLVALTQLVAGADKRELDRLIASDSDVAALGRFTVTQDPRDIGKFRTPSLRNVALTAPYMHDGSVPTLAAAIDSEVYYRSLERGRPLILTPLEKADLVAFLEALTSANATDVRIGETRQVPGGP